MTLNDFMKLTQSIKNRMFMMLARGIVKAVRNTEGTQKLQIVALADETIDNIERLQEYGLETYPDTDAEAFAAFVGGNREIGVVLVTHDRRYRPKTLVSGEVMVYTKFGQQILLDKNGKVIIKSGTIELGDGTLRRLIDERVVAKLNAHIIEYNGHMHPTAAVGAPSIPSVLAQNFVLDDFGTTVTKAE